MACSLWSIVFTTRLHGQQSRYQTRSSDVGVDVESAARSGFTSGLFQQQMVDTDRRCSSSCTFAVPRRQQEVDSRTAATDVQKQQLSLPCIYCTHGHAWRSAGLLAYAGPGIAAQAARRRRDDDCAEQFRDRSKLPLERLWIVWAASEPRSQGKAAAADEDDGRQLDQD